VRIEHLGLQVKDPAAMAEWYCRHLGFEIKRAIDEPNVVRFLADSSGKVMFEIYYNPAANVPDYAAMDPLVLHVAYVCDDVRAASERLQSAGATFVEEVGPTPAGDYLHMLRDPWGLPVQLAHRGEAMV
jgi:catechol 2,3-dioxygenase-like lactoylglutathione lyase family enzyme